MILEDSKVIDFGLGLFNKYEKIDMAYVSDVFIKRLARYHTLAPALTFVATMWWTE
jgi:hypothetical protein